MRVHAASAAPANSRLSRQPQATWELVLLVALIADIAINATLSPYFLDAQTLSDASFNFTEKGIVALPLAFLIISGEIDISVAGTIALASVCMGLLAQMDCSTPVLALAGITVGSLAGAINGLLVAGLRVPSIVATIGTMSLYRGCAYALLGDRVLKHYPDNFAFFGQGYVTNLIPLELVLFFAVALTCATILHWTIAGRRIYAIGANSNTARFSGINTQHYRFWLFVATGAASGLTSILLTSRLGSTRPSIAQGWELEIISMVILGGVSVTGGRGTIVGVILATILMGSLTFGLGLLNIPGIVLSILVGFLLIAVASLPYLLSLNSKKRHVL